MISEILIYLGMALLLVAVEVLYFKIAERFSIIDKPNQRSSHSIPTVRGGGIIFAFAVLAWFVVNGFAYPLFVAGLVLISLVSFLDDIKERPVWLRFLIHLVAFFLLLNQAQIVQEPAWIILLITIICLGTINAFNFMDGINGITGVYALVNLLTLLFINETMSLFTTTSLLIVVTISILIFLFFNFRVKARCFAGDVGSIALAFIQLFFLLQLCHATQYYGWILLFLMFGVDTVVTIIYRLRNKENIFKSHRLHLFQFLSNELKVPQLHVSIAYGAIQLAMNAILIVCINHDLVWLPVVLLVGTGIVYVMVRESVLKKIGLKGLFRQ